MTYEHWMINDHLPVYAEQPCHLKKADEDIRSDRTYQKGGYLAVPMLFGAKYEPLYIKDERVKGERM